MRLSAAVLAAALAISATTNIDGVEAKQSKANISAAYMYLRSSWMM